MNMTAGQRLTEYSEVKDALVSELMCDSEGQCKSSVLIDVTTTMWLTQT